MKRRHFLQSSTLGLALPALESLGPLASAAAGDATDSAPVKRLVTIGTYLGFHTSDWFPKEAGRDYQITPMLQPLEGLRDQFTLVSGLDHRGPGGHANWKNYLTGTPRASISLDQIAAKAVGNQTRFDSLQVDLGSSSGSAPMSFTKEGIALPPITRPSVLFKTLFSSGADKARMDYLLDSNGSLLDHVMGEANTLKGQVSSRDALKLDEYFSAIRDVEKQVEKSREWLKVPPPKVDYFELPEVDPIVAALSLECEEIMYSIMGLALETDSTRVISLMVPGANQVFSIDGVRLTSGYHKLSHHGNVPERIAEFNVIGTEHMTRFTSFLGGLQEKTDAEGRPLLDTTAVLFGSGMGNANKHDNSRLPILLAGGPFKHGAYHAIDRDNATDTTPILGDLFLTILQSMGIEQDKFAKANRNMNDVLL
jgi:hypothetical protein